MTIEWEKHYKAAILETDWSKMEERLHAVDLAIKARLYEFSQNHGGTPEENRAIGDALKALAVLRHEFAEWQAAKSR